MHSCYPVLARSFRKKSGCHAQAFLCPFSKWQTPLCNRHLCLCNIQSQLVPTPKQGVMPISKYITILQNFKNCQVWARLTDDTLYVGCVSLTIQVKRDLKALSYEKIMINKCIDYSHIIRWHIRKISFGWKTIK